MNKPDQKNKVITVYLKEDSETDTFSVLLEFTEKLVDPNMMPGLMVSMVRAYIAEMVSCEIIRNAEVEQFEAGLLKAFNEEFTNENIGPAEAGNAFSDFENL